MIRTMMLVLGLCAAVDGLFPENHDISCNRASTWYPEVCQPKGIAEERDFALVSSRHWHLSRILAQGSLRLLPVLLRLVEPC